MRSRLWRIVSTGFVFGLVAGLTFGVSQMFVSLLVTGTPALPLKMAATLVAGPRALIENDITTLFIGAMTHFSLSILFGLVYGAVNALILRSQLVSYQTQAITGALFGVLLWLLNMQIVARVLYPWFLDANQGVQVLLHAFCFGVPLGLGFASRSQRRLRENDARVASFA